MSASDITQYANASANASANVNVNVFPPEPPSSFMPDPPVMYIPGEFLYITNDFTRQCMKNGWDAVTTLELWAYMKKDTDSYMFSTDAEVYLIYKKMEKMGIIHSGTTFGITMRNLQYIAQNGEEEFMKKCI